jgi:hypothetical protein
MKTGLEITSLKTRLQRFGKLFFTKFSINEALYVFGWSDVQNVGHLIKYLPT